MGAGEALGVGHVAGLGDHLHVRFGVDQQSQPLTEPRCDRRR
jgi:hypothetical protein